MPDPDIKDDVEVRHCDEIHPYGENPKKHPSEQVDKIASSIIRFGWDQPIVVDDDGVIVKGHGRYQAAQKLGLSKVPTIVHDDLTGAEARAARLADNRVSDTEFDDELLSSELELLKESPDLSVEATGFDDRELDDLLDQPPDIDPTSELSQPDLGTTTTAADSDTVACPECGHEFDPE